MQIVVFMHWKMYHSKMYIAENIYPLVILLLLQKFERLKENYVFIMLSFCWISFFHFD